MSTTRRRMTWFVAAAAAIVAIAVWTKREIATSTSAPPVTESHAIARLAPVLSTSHDPSPTGRTTGLRGVVIHPDGTPATGASVRLVESDLWATTGDDGSFELAAKPGDYTLEAQTDDEAGGPVGVHVRAETSDTTIVLRRGVIVDVTVEDIGSHAPIAGANVAVTVMTPLLPEGDPPIVRVSDAHGHAVFRAIPSDNGAITVTAAGHAPVHAAIIPKLVHDHVRRVTIALGGGIAVTGHVVDDRGRAVAGAKVFASPSRGTDVVSGDELAPAVTTDASGAFELRAKPPFYVKAVHPDYLTAASGFVKPDASEATNLVLAMAPGSRVTGTVVDSAGAPVAHARVFVTIPRKHSVVRTAESSDDGRFAFDHLPPIVELVARSDDRSSVPVEVRDGTATLTLARDGALSGTVVDAKGEPVAGAIVECLPVITDASDKIVASQAESLRNLVVADDAGRFSFRGLERALSPADDPARAGATRYRLEAQLPPATQVGPPVRSGEVIVELGDGARVAFTEWSR